MNSVRAGCTPDAAGAPQAWRLHTRSRRITGITLLSTVLLVVSCGGRIELIPLPQIGRLSADAVMASTSGVTVVVRTDAWPTDPVILAGLLPLEITVDNRSGRSLRIDHLQFALIHEGHRISALAPTDAQVRSITTRSAAPTTDIVEAALADGILDADERVTGFVYFPPVDESDEVILVVDLVDSSTGSQLGVMRIPFSAE